jgi:hypothetical protein
VSDFAAIKRRSSSLASVAGPSFERQHALLDRAQTLGQVGIRTFQPMKAREIAAGETLEATQNFGLRIADDLADLSRSCSSSGIFSSLSRGLYPLRQLYLLRKLAG